MRSSVKKETRTTRSGALLASALLAGLACGCSGPPPKVEAVGASTTYEAGGLDYHFDSLDARPVTSAAMRGKTTVLAFVTTFDLESQAEVDYLATMAKNDGDQVNYVVVALEPAGNRELVEAFRHFVDSKFGVSLVMAMGDETTIAGSGPFGDVHVVPEVVVLDKEGRIAWRLTGLSKNADIRAAMAHAR